MTATTSSMQPGPDPQSTHRDPANQPERLGTIPWDLLGASDYRTALSDLGSWLAWLVPTYRIPPSVIPPCWFLHPGLIEELGHLWTGWRVTQHPDTGVGMTGLDWDGHRERATGRLRELVATAGCNGTSHSPKPGPGLNRDDKLWETALQEERARRTARFAEQTIRSAAEIILKRAEQRNELAPDVLADIAADPAHPTQSEIGRATIALDHCLAIAVADAHERSRDARIHLDTHRSRALLGAEVDAARNDLLVRMTSSATLTELQLASRRWVVAATRAEPAEEALRRTTALKAGKLAAATKLGLSKSRHIGISDLLSSRTDH